MTARAPGPLHRAARRLTWASSAAAVGLTAHSVWNARQLRRPPLPASAPTEWVSVLLPVRDEAQRLEPTLRALMRALDACEHRAELVVLDDESTDGTADLVRAVCGADVRVRLVSGEPTPAGWLGKPWACSQLAAQASSLSSVLVFVDADVVVAPDAICATVAQLREAELDLVCPYPRQEARGWGERLVQPLLQWSWLTTLPLRLAERSPRPSLVAANGQLLAVDRATYERAGGHFAVRADVLDDVGLLRAVKAVGGRGGVTDGTHLATCPMYDARREVAAGYTTSLRRAFGSPVGGVAVASGLGAVYVWPALAAVSGSPVGALGYAAGVAGRVVTGRRTGARVWPDALAHPVSVAVFGWLTARSVRLHRRSALQWKGRPLP
ncbi:MAG: glycosyltransferase [Angustibacter sp.]